MMMMMQADKIERQRVTCSSLYGRRFEFFGGVNIRVECVIQVENSIPLMETPLNFFEKFCFQKKIFFQNTTTQASINTNSEIKWQNSAFTLIFPLVHVLSSLLWSSCI